ncbi:pertactin-like passenger domain-containing protein [Ruegeria lacuscaerulensis]|uniref:pertactin-like passenger domain-containing protein n=1 Tax=Ruegeria lacuscaerulensis TaxID=55218 RepID=UPI00147C48F9|nr:pertactin-like passenger domain-containing protein [Ruegeria lacuscaerulensis]
MSNTEQGANLPGNRAILLRGGRMAKHKGQIASYAPSPGRVLSSVSTTALGAAISLAGRHGISASNRGTDLSVESTGTVTGSRHVKFASNRGTGNLTVDVGDAISTNDGYGIHARNYGSGILSVSLSGSFEVGSEDGIETLTNAGNLSVIELRQSASVLSASDEAITNNEGVSQVGLAAGSAFSGAVLLYDGRDALMIEGGADISAATVFDGGGATRDTLTFSAFTGTLGGTLSTNWESLTADNGSTLNLDNTAAGFGLVTAQNGPNEIAMGSGLNLGGELQIDATSNFLASHADMGNVAISGDTFNDGLIRLADGQSGDRVTVGGDLSGSGSVTLDVDFASGTNDRIIVSGDSAGARQRLHVRIASGHESTLQNTTLAVVSGKRTASDFRLADGDFVANSGKLRSTQTHMRF